MRPDSPMIPAPTVAYDANGNTLSDASGKSYTWDFENRLTQAVVPGTGTVKLPLRSVRQTHSKIRAAWDHQLPL